MTCKYVQCMAIVQQDVYLLYTSNTAGLILYQIFSSSNMTRLFYATGVSVV
jgi:hypothetical protein